jgi:hypothetical protein
VVGFSTKWRPPIYKFEITDTQIVSLSTVEGQHYVIDIPATANCGVATFLSELLSSEMMTKVG